MTSIKTRIAAGAALSAAAAGLILTGTGAASAQPYTTADGHYSVSSLGIDPLHPFSPVTVGEVWIHGDSIRYNGVSGTIRKTPSDESTSAVGTLPIYGPFSIQSDIGQLNVAGLALHLTPLR